MDERTLSKFTFGLPIPQLNALQDRLAAEIVRLEALLDEPTVRSADAASDVWSACSSPAGAMGAAGVERNRTASLSARTTTTIARPSGPTKQRADRGMRSRSGS